MPVLLRVLLAPGILARRRRLPRHRRRWVVVMMGLVGGKRGGVGLGGRCRL